MTSFIAELNQASLPEPEQNVFADIWNEYEKVVLHSLITSFGLDFLVHDQYGGDVDTIHNVRKIGQDSRMFYKNEKNQKDYENRAIYDSLSYHRDPRYININRQYSEARKKGVLQDTYTGQMVSRNSRIDLDHVISAKEIHNDRGRILAGLDGRTLANCEENLKPTDRSINRSMKDKNIETYLVGVENSKIQRQNRIRQLKKQSYLSERESKELKKLQKIEQIDTGRMQKENIQARKSYESKIEQAYYMDSEFFKDAAKAAKCRGTEMGIRQAVGFLFVEIWFASREELQKIAPNSSLKTMLKAVEAGIKEGTGKAKEDYKELFAKFGEGFIAGILSSVSTTVSNIFITTEETLIKNIRQIYASVVEAGRVLLFNPDNLMFGDRIRTTTIILATGVSVLIGGMFGELIGRTPVSQIPGVGIYVQIFCSTLISGLLSCTLLVFLDRSKFINEIVDALNRIPTEANNYKEIADTFEELAIKLEQIDIDIFRKEVNEYRDFIAKVEKAENEEEIQRILISMYQKLEMHLPWEGDFDFFMSKKSNRLIFE